MTTFASSAIADANGTLLTGSVCATGGPWVIDGLPSGATAPTVHTGMVLTHQASFDETCARLRLAGSPTDYRITAVWNSRYAAHGTVDGELYVGGRLHVGGWNGYVFGWYRNSLFQIRKYRDIGTAQNYFPVIQAGHAQPTDGSHTSELIFVTNGSGKTEITCKYDGVVIFDQWTDTGAFYEAIQTTGDAGFIQWSGTNFATQAASDINLDSLVVDSVPAGAQKLGLTRAPGGAIPGAVCTVQPKVALKDYYNVTQTGFADTITISVLSGPGSLSGTVAQAVNTGTGEATWTNLAFSAAGTYSLQATGATGTITFSFDVVAKTANYSATILGVAFGDAGLGALCDGLITELRTGVQPATTAAAATGTILAISFGADVGFLEYPTTTGVTALVPPKPVVAVASGTPTWQRTYKADHTTVLFDSPAGLSTVVGTNVASITAGQRVQLECMVLRDSLNYVSVATQLFAEVAIGGTMAGGAELPRVLVDTTVPTTTATKTVGLTGRDYTDLQTAITAVAAGSVATAILVDNGYDYTPPGGGGLILPARASTVPIVIRPVTLAVAQGTRMTPALAATNNLPRIRLDNNGAAISTAAGAWHYHMLGFEVLPSVVPPANPFSIAWLSANTGPGGQGNTYADTPQYITLDRMYMHGGTGCNVIHAVGLQGDYTACVDSYISEVHDETRDCTGLSIWMPKGPIKFVNNYCEALTENALLGGAQSNWPGVVPADIEVRFNTFAKDPAWHGVWNNTKCIFEMKGGKRVWIEGNYFKYNWEGNKGWYGPCITLKVTSEGGNSALGHWRTSDVVVRHNWIEATAGMINVSPLPASDPSTPLARVYVTNLLGVRQNTIPAVTVFNRPWPVAFGNNTARLQIRDVVMEHITAVYPTGGIMVSTGDVGTAGGENFILKNSVFAVAGDLPVQGAGNGYVDDNLAFYWGPSSDLAHNVTQCGQMQTAGYPLSVRGTNNKWLLNTTDLTYAYMQFTNAAADDYSVRTTSPAHLYATDGTDSGVDMPALLASLAGGGGASIPGAVSAPWYRRRKHTKTP